MEQCLGLYRIPHNQEFNLNAEYDIGKWEVGISLGVLPKRYIKINNNIAFMDKTGTFDSNSEMFCKDEPVLERIVYEIGKYLGINVAHYELVYDDVLLNSKLYRNTLISRSKWFLNNNEQLKHYSELAAICEGNDKYDTLIRTFPLCRKDIDNMIILDYLIGNSDRHGDNLGFKYNEKNRTITLAPIFDNGTCGYLTNISIEDLEELEDSGASFDDLDFEEVFEECTGINLMEHLDDNFTCKSLALNNYHLLQKVVESDILDKLSIENILDIVERYRHLLGNAKTETMKFSLNLRFKELELKFKK